MAENPLDSLLVEVRLHVLVHIGRLLRAAQPAHHGMDRVRALQAEERVWRPRRTFRWAGRDSLMRVSLTSGISRTRRSWARV
eukprot:5375598-Prymnesium_polylepis.1